MRFLRQSKIYSSWDAMLCDGIYHSFLNKALQLLTRSEQQTIQDHLSNRGPGIQVALDNAYNAAQQKWQLCQEEKMVMDGLGPGHCCGRSSRQVHPLARQIHGHW